MEPPRQDWCPYKNTPWALPPSLSATWGDSKKAAVCKAGGGLSPGTELASTLILAFPVSRTVRNKCLWFKLPSLVFYYDHQSWLRQRGRDDIMPAPASPSPTPCPLSTPHSSLLFPNTNLRSPGNTLGDCLVFKCLRGFCSLSLFLTNNTISQFLRLQLLFI